jgi:hypothetical protein
MQSGDVILTLGAGNIYQAGEEILKFLEGTLKPPEPEPKKKRKRK